MSQPQTVSEEKKSRPAVSVGEGIFMIVIISVTGPGGAIFCALYVMANRKV